MASRDSISQLPMINIDHHLGNALYGEANWVDSAAPAVGEMVFRLAQAMRLELDDELGHRTLPRTRDRHRRLSLRQRDGPGL